MGLETLETYDITPERGFLCAHDAACVALDGAVGEVRELALRLPEILPTGAVRDVLERLSLIAPAAVAELDGPQARMAMVHYSFLVQAYIWGAETTVSVLPPSLAIPAVALADRLGQQPLLQYSGYVLDNWGRLDPARPVSLDNIYVIQKFAAGTDEAWFVLVHVAIEARAGEALALYGPLIEAAANGDADRAQALLEQIVGVWAAINALFDRMPEQCDPYIYFRRVRPYIHGWKDNPALDGGVVYQGVERFGGRPQAFRGAVQAVADFRSRHLEYAASYINRQGRRSAGNDTEIGTGGTPFMKYLKKHRDETKANLLVVQTV